MKKTKKSLKKLLFIFCLLSLFTVQAIGDDSSSNKRRRKGPPPEAYTACEDNSAGDTAEFVSPRGDTITGTCEEEGDRLVLRPDNHPGKKGRSKRDSDDD